MMKPRTVRIISAVIAAILVGAFLFGILADGIVFAGAATTDELKDQLSALEQQKAEVKETIAGISGEMDQVAQTQQALAQEMDITKQEIDTVEAFINQLDTQIDIKTKELTVAEEQLQKKEELFSERVRVMYENGETSYLDVLLNATSFTNMLSRMDIVSQIMDYDQRIVTEYTAAKEDIRVKRDDLQTTQDEQKDYQNNLQYKVEELQQQEQEQAALQESLEAYKAETEAEYDRLAAEMESVSNEIAEMSRQSAAASGGQITISAGGFVWPTPSCTSTSSAYGYRVHPIYGTTKFHAGEDIPASYGAEILATKGGTVVTAGWVSGYGNYTVIDHGGGVMSAYGHQSSIIVSVGQQVSAGQVIGYVGSTGNSTGPHLHFEIYVNGATIDPKSVF